MSHLCDDFFLDIEDITEKRDRQGRQCNYVEKVF